MFNPAGVNGFCGGVFPRAHASAVIKISGLRPDCQVFYAKKDFLLLCACVLVFFFNGQKDIKS